MPVSSPSGIPFLSRRWRSVCKSSFWLLVLRRDSLNSYGMTERQPHTLESARALLQRVYGYEAFRGLQEPVISDVLSGRDALAVLPPGGGKSLCYQIPSMLRDGVGLIVSPLIA